MMTARNRREDIFGLAPAIGNDTSGDVTAEEEKGKAAGLGDGGAEIPHPQKRRVRHPKKETARITGWRCSVRDCGKTRWPGGASPAPTKFTANSVKLLEGCDAGDFFADHQFVDVVGAFVGVDR